MGGRSEFESPQPEFPLRNTIRSTPSFAYRNPALHDGPPYLLFQKCIFISWFTHRFNYHPPLRQRQRTFPSTPAGWRTYIWSRSAPRDCFKNINTL
ncbi:unnamed protein product [Nesidiocoris tenuis]|uniref:Uncharacterized protein n=1 Tax=Nesidiocoris tenuis TaxID=355587 RepID=A0A6H5HT55_9HEMI|nr:unnamed protein product [Nesidiocoris tenuis]